MFVILRKGHRLSVFENRVVKKIFGSKKDEVTGEWRRLHKEELYDFFFPMPPHVLMNFRGFPPGCRDSVADF